MNVAEIKIDLPYQQCIMIYGMRGKGKTKFLHWLLDQYDIRGIRFVLFDTAHQFTKWKPKHGTIISPPFAQKMTYFLKACRQIWKQGNTVFAIEEIDQYCSPRWLPPELDSIVNIGRNRRISFIATTRRIADVHKDIIANCDYHFIFKAFLPRDLEEYQKYVGRMVWMAKDLPDYHFIYYKVGSQPHIMRPIKLLT